MRAYVAHTRLESSEVSAFIFPVRRDFNPSIKIKKIMGGGKNTERCKSFPVHELHFGNEHVGMSLIYGQCCWDYAS